MPHAMLIIHAVVANLDPAFDKLGSGSGFSVASGPDPHPDPGPKSL